MDELIIGEKAIAELYIFGRKQNLGAGTELIVTGPDSFQNHWNQYGAQHATTGVPVLMRYIDRNSKKVVAMFQRNLVGSKAGTV